MKNKECILRELLNDSCSPVSPIHTGFHGSTGDGGRVGNAKVPKEYRNATLGNSPVAEDQPLAYEVFNSYISTYNRQFKEGYLG